MCCIVDAWCAQGHAEYFMCCIVDTLCAQGHAEYFLNIQGQVYTIVFGSACNQFTQLNLIRFAILTR